MILSRNCNALATRLLFCSLIFQATSYLHGRYGDGMKTLRFEHSVTRKLLGIALLLVLAAVGSGA